MPKILGEHRINKKQILEEVGPTGYISSDFVVLWDERINGPMPKNIIDSVGAVSIENGRISVDETKLEQVMLEKSAKLQAELDKKNKRQSALDDILNTDDSKNLSAAEVQAALKAIIKYLKNKEI